MTYLLKLEWKKFSQNSVVRLLLLFFVLFTPCGLFMASNFDLGNINPLLPTENTFFSFPGVWEYLGYSGNWTVFFFLGVVMIYLICAEINYKTERQSIINGLDRKSYFSSKLISLLALAIFATLYYSIWGISVGVIYTDNYDFGYIFTNDWAIPRFLLMSIGYLSFAMVVAFVLRKSGLAIFVYFSYVLIIESIIRWQGHRKIFEGASTKYYPMNATEDLMPNPVWKLADFMPMKDLSFDPLLPYSHAAIVSGISSIAFIGLAWYIFNRRDI